MGLLLINKAISNTDDYPMYFSNMPDKTLFKKANIYNKKTTSAPQYINISNNQGVFILENGKFSDFCFSEGVYYIEECSSPAFIFGRCDRQTVDMDFFTNSDFSFLGKDKQCMFINFRPINDINIFPPSPIEYRYNNKDYLIDFSGVFSVKISDPFTLFQRIATNDDGEYCITDSFVTKISQDLLSCILDELKQCSIQNVSPEELEHLRNDIIKNATNRVTFAKALGLNLTDVRIDDIGFVPAEEDIVEEPEPDMKRFSQFSVQPVMPIEMPQEYIEENVKEHKIEIPEDFDFNVETMEIGTIEENTENIDTTRDIQEVNFDFTAYEEKFDNAQNSQEDVFVQQPPKQDFQQYIQLPVETVDDYNTEESNNSNLSIERPQHTQHIQQVTPFFPLTQNVPPNTFENTVQSMQIQPKKEEPKHIDVGIEGLNLSMSDMSVEKPVNKPQNATIFSPFGEDNEWLCPNCLNEAMGDFCGFCGQRRATPFKVMLNTSDNSQWMCRSCGTQNYLKFCSNCGQPKPIENTQQVVQQPPKFCPSCGYNFTNFQGVPKFCPECGLKF